MTANYNINKLKITEINPYVRFINLLQCESNFSTGPRKIYDNQLLYIHKGKGMLEIENKEYIAFPGDIFFYKPGTTHNMIADPEEPFLLTGIHFDFTQNHKDKKHPIGPLSLEEYNPELITEKTEFHNFCGFPAKLHLLSQFKSKETFIKIIEEFKNQKIYSQELINSLFHSWLIKIIRYITTNKAGKINNSINNIIQYLRENYNQEITNKGLADIFNYHPAYISELLQKHTGMPVRQYLINIRIRKAIDLLLFSDKNITQIAREVGYSNIHYFSRLFKSKTGFPPSKIKKYIS